MDEASDEAALAALLVTTATTMMMMTTVATIPATDIPIDACPSFLALSWSDSAVLLATTAHTSSTCTYNSSSRYIRLRQYDYYY